MDKSWAIHLKRTKRETLNRTQELPRWLLDNSHWERKKKNIRGTEQKGKLDPKQRNLELERRVKIGPASKNAKTGREVSVTMQKRKQINKSTNVVWDMTSVPMTGARRRSDPEDCRGVPRRASSGRKCWLPAFQIPPQTRGSGRAPEGAPILWGPHRSPLKGERERSKGCQSCFTRESQWRTASKEGGLHLISFTTSMWLECVTRVPLTCKTANSTTF